MRGSKILYLDLVGGAAGDMILAALLDAGAKLERVQSAIASVVPGLRVREGTRYPAGVRAKTVAVDEEPKHDFGHDHEHDQEHGHRPYRVVEAMLRAASLSEGIRDQALKVFLRLGQAEAEAHGVSLSEVMFHEVGADDAIADIVGTLAAVEDLGITFVVVSPVPLSRGLGTGRHGPLPFPGPATLSLLAGAPVLETHLNGETVTPTGAALITTLAQKFGPIPSMILLKTGIGAGSRDWPDRPNIVRALIGEEVKPTTLESSTECVVEANLDDMSPAQVPALERALFAIGAVDVWATPIHLKKGRSGLTVAALISRNAIEAATAAFLTHSTTLGVRVSEVTRHRASREIRTVETEFGTVRVKVSPRPRGPDLQMPELDDCERLADLHQVPVRAVFEAAQRAAWRA